MLRQFFDTIIQTLVLLGFLAFSQCSVFLLNTKQKQKKTKTKKKKKMCVEVIFCNSVGVGAEPDGEQRAVIGGWVWIDRARGLHPGLLALVGALAYLAVKVGERG